MKKRFFKSLVFLEKNKQVKWLLSPYIFWPIFYFGISNPLYSCKQQPETILPDDKIQATIQRVIYAKGEDDKEAKEAMNKLTGMAHTIPEILAPQIIYYSMFVKNEKEGVGILGIMKDFGTRWNIEMRKGLFPLLETKDEKTFIQVASWLAGIDGYGQQKLEDNLLFYREILKPQKENPPPGLVNYVYYLAPSKALVMFDDIYWKQPWPHKLKWSDHIINIVQWRIKNRFLQDGDLAKAQKELESLSKHEGWYARRYVVEVIREFSVLGTPDIVNRLKRDNNLLVSEAAKLLRKKGT